MYACVACIHAYMTHTHTFSVYISLRFVYMCDAERRIYVSVRIHFRVVSVLFGEDCVHSCRGGCVCVCVCVCVRARVCVHIYMQDTDTYL